MNNCLAASPRHEMREKLTKLLRRTVGEYKKDKRANLARNLNWDYSRTKELSLGRAKPEVEEMDLVRQLTEEKQKENKDDATLLQRLDRIESMLAGLLSVDPEFYGQDVSHYRKSIDAVRRVATNKSGGDLER